MAVELNDEGEPMDPHVSEVGNIIYKAIGHNWEIGFDEGYWDAAAALLSSDWLRLKFADAFDDGVGRAGRYGHEDGWDGGMSPYKENPYRTRAEMEEDGWDMDEEW